MPIILDKVNYCYSADSAYKVQALKDIDLKIEDGQFIGIIGHTGSGKSTLVQHLNGLLKATSGHIYYNGEDIYDEDYDLRQLRNKVGMVFQYPEHQLFEETVAKDVAFGPKNLKLSEEEIQERVKWAIEMVGLDFEKMKDVSPFELSGGQMRRVAIAGVLAMRPEVLILDEPTAGLDPHGRDMILGQIEKLHKATGNTVILVSHSMEDVGRYADRILVMYKGKAVYYDTPTVVFRHVDELEKMGLAVPEVKYLMRALKKQNPEVNDDIFTVEAAKAEIERVFGGERHV